MDTMFPIFLNVRGRHCLVVGGGAVGLRKARALVAAGAQVTLVCLEPEAHDIPAGMDWRTERYQAAHLHGMSLAFAAAIVDVNKQVVADAQARQIWVNSATDSDDGDFILPAVATEGRIQIAVGTEGASPAIAAHIRDLFAERIEKPMVEWVNLVAEIRDEVRLKFPQERRADLLRQLADVQWLERIRQEGLELVRCAFRAVVDQEQGR